MTFAMRSSLNTVIFSSSTVIVGASETALG